MSQKTKDYNLLEEEWIPVLYSNGYYRRVGIRTALLEAGRIRQIAASNPMDNVALMRLLLAVLQWCKPNLTDEDRKELEGASGIRKDWVKGLGTEKEPHSGFNLLGDPAYYQVLQSDKETKPGPNVLLHEAPSGTNKAHFRHIYDKEASLCLACCALGLTRLPAFTASEGSGKFPGINQVPPIYFLPRFETLLQTLLANWPMPKITHDQPAWDTPGSVISDENEVGVLEGFTWIPRQVRIARPFKKGCCAWCGKADDVSSDIAFSKPLKEDAEKIKRRVLNNKWRDPHVAYLEEPRKSTSSDAVNTGSAKARDCLNDPWNAAGEWRRLWLRLLDPSTDAYIGAPSWLLKAQKKTEPNEVIDVQAVGFATDGKANYFDAWEGSFQLPTEIMQEPARSAIVREEADWLDALIGRTIDAKTREWKKPVKKLRSATFLERTSRPNRKVHHLRAAVCQLRQHAETLLRAKFLTFLNDIKSLPCTEWENARKEWRRGVEEVLACELRSALAASIGGSSLRRQEAMQQVEGAVREARHQADREIEQERTAAANKSDRKRQKRGTR